MFGAVLVANRGEIARRIIGTLRRLGIRSIAVHSEADAGLPYVTEADVAVPLGPSPPAASYLDGAKLLAAAARTGAEAVHPGYGFLSENAAFARAVTRAGLTWIGPDPDTIEAMGDKINARNLMAQAGVPVSPGSTRAITGADDAVELAADIGYPVMVKAAAGGGGIGMSSVSSPSQLRDLIPAAQQRAQRAFGSKDLLLERYLTTARHIEVQILGDGAGGVVALGERDCSVQRRHQKIVEETPAPRLPEAVRTELRDAAVTAGERIGYRGAGTVEFLYDPERGETSFLEMNTRLQVEHPITELVTGIDLVEAQLRIAAGEVGGVDEFEASGQGHAIEFRIYAEDPKRFLPSPGRISRWREPYGAGIRMDAGYQEGNLVTPFYDPLLAKLCVHGSTRAEAVGTARSALEEFVVAGPKTNLPFLRELLDHNGFAEGHYDTTIVSELRPGSLKQL